MLSQISQILNFRFIRSFLFDDPELFDRISDDYTDAFLKDSFDPSKSQWIGFFDGDVCKAIISTTPETSVAFNIHISVPKKHRAGQSFKMCSEILKCIENNCGERYVKINAVIPIIYKDVAKFLIKLGFSLWGIEKESFLKNGALVDRLHFSKKIGV